MLFGEKSILIWRMIYSRIQDINGYLVVMALVLSLCGIMNIHSATGGDRTLVACFHVALGLILMLSLAMMPVEWIMRISLPLYVIGVFLLIMVMFFGVSAKGAQRWLSLGFIRFQPSEMMKLAVPMVIAFALHHLHERKRWMQFPLALLVLTLPFLLIVKQPDLGTALLVAASGLLVIYLAGLPWKLIIGGAVLGALLTPIYWQYGMKDYQKHRVMTLIDPYNDPLGKGYHIIQSTIAIGSGGILGKGYQQGSQSQLDFLPEPHTDFAFAVWAEEWGFIGFLLLLVLNLLLVQQCLKCALQSYSLFGRLLAGSLGLTFFVYVFINTGMVSGILPVVGVPLPFISYGGTSALITFAMMGMILACGKPIKEADIIFRYHR